MGRFDATPATEELAAFLQGLPPGAHVAVGLGALPMDVAAYVSRQVADARGARFVAVAHRGSHVPPLVADSLPDALPLETFVSMRRKALVVVDAASSMAARSAKAHAEAEGRLGTEVAPRLIVVCFYTEEALRQATHKDVHRLHGVVAMPAQV